MASISVRDLPDPVRDRLRERAAKNGRSMEAETRAILIAAVHETPAETDLVDELRRVAAEYGGIELDIPPRTELAQGVDFS